MTTITRFTKEQLIARADHLLCVGKAFIAEHPEYDGMAKDVELFKIALASITAEPVAYTEKCEITNMQATGLYLRGFPNNSQGRDIALYAAPPAPVVPDEIRNKLKAEGLAELLKDARDYAPLTAAQWETLTNNWHQTFVGLSGENDACRAAMLQGAEPVSNRDELPGLIEGMEVSVDVSTCDTDAGHRYFGTVTEVSELDGAKNGYILLVQDAEPNFKHTGNSPVIPDGWESCKHLLPIGELIHRLEEQTGEKWIYAKDAIPDGYALVPKELSCEMDDAAWEAYHETRSMSDIWAALLSAAPQQEAKNV